MGSLPVKSEWSDTINPCNAMLIKNLKCKIQNYKKLCPSILDLSSKVLTEFAFLDRLDVTLSKSVYALGADRLTSVRLIISS